jgi:DNA-binding NarL/FixJ family response regulator
MSMPTAMNPRILLVDDNASFLAFLSTLLRQQGNIDVVGEARDGKDAVYQAQSLQPDLILLDIGLPELNGIEAAYRIRELVPNAKIVFVSNECSREVVQEALHLGACGYIQKIFAARNVPDAINAVLKGEQFLSTELAGFKLAPVA